MCLPSGDVTDPQVRPGGLHVSAVVTEIVEGRARNRLVLWTVAEGAETTVLHDPEPASGRGLSGGVHDWHPDGESVVVVTRGDGVVRLDLEGLTVGSLPLDPSRSWSTPVHHRDGTRVAIVADWNELFVVEDGTARSVMRIDDGYLMDAAWAGDEPTAHV